MGTDKEQAEADKLQELMAQELDWSVVESNTERIETLEKNYNELINIDEPLKIYSDKDKTYYIVNLKNLEKLAELEEWKTQTDEYLEKHENWLVELEQKTDMVNGTIKALFEWRDNFEKVYWSWQNEHMKLIKMNKSVLTKTLQLFRYKDVTPRTEEVDKYFEEREEIHDLIKELSSTPKPFKDTRAWKLAYPYWHWFWIQDIVLKAQDEPNPFKNKKLSHQEIEALIKEREPPAVEGNQYVSCPECAFDVNITTFIQEALNRERRKFLADLKHEKDFWIPKGNYNGVNRLLEKWEGRRQK